MTEAQTLPDMFKSAVEVTTLATTDRILAMDDNGNPRKISQSNAVRQDTYLASDIPSGDAQWYRIATMTEYGSCVIMTIAVTGFYDTWNYPLVFCLNAPHGGSAANISVSPLNHPRASTSGGMYPVTKIRISGSERLKYIDVYVPAYTKVRKLKVAITNAIYCTLMTPTANPATLATVKEFDVATVWGGVNQRFTISYDLPLSAISKGGVPHDRSTEALQRDPQISNDRRLHSEEQLRRSKHLHHAWLLQGLCQCRRNTLRGIRLRDVVGHSNQHKLRVADIHPQSPEHLRQEPLGRLATMAIHSHRDSRLSLTSRKEVAA